MWKKLSELILIFWIIAKEKYDIIKENYKEEIN